MEQTRKIHCVTCEGPVRARLTDGREIYPHRPDLAELPIWKCDACGNYVGTHHRASKDKLAPLGCIASPALRGMRQEIHDVIDPLWRSRKIKRRELYKEMTRRLGWKRSFHTSKTRSLEEAQEALAAAKEISRELQEVAHGVTR